MIIAYLVHQLRPRLQAHSLLSAHRHMALHSPHFSQICFKLVWKWPLLELIITQLSGFACRHFGSGLRCGYLKRLSESIYLNPMRLHTVIGRFVSFFAACGADQS